MSHLDVQGISKWFGSTRVLHDVSLVVQEGEAVCLLGPSGCGKTTLLRIVAGLETADQGRVFLGDRDLAEIPVHRRGFGLMFQDFALFPHKDVEANIVFGLRMQGLAPDEIGQRVAEMLRLVSLEGYGHRKVYDLSGGEQQRVALARSLAPRPRLLMLDEPLGSLDRTLREGLMGELRSILKTVGVTTLYVTHDQEEAFVVGDRVLIMDRGRVVQAGVPQVVYRRPASEFVARFLGLSNLLSGRVTSVSPRLEVTTALGTLSLGHSRAGAGVVGEEVTLVVRPEAAVAVLPEGAVGPNVVCGRLVSRMFRGSSYRVRTAHTGGINLEFEVAAGSELPMTGETLYLSLDAEALALLPRNSHDPNLDGSSTADERA